MTASLNFNPPVIAHRGASGYAPENTIAAFIKSAQLGIKWIEFDVMLAADDTAIIFHDEEIDRTTNEKGLLHNYSYSFLQGLDVGSWFNPIFAGERIPTLLQVIEFLEEMHMSANVELKPLPGQEDELAKRVLEDIPAALIKENSKILFSSFSYEALVSLRKQSEDCLIGLLLHEWRNNWEMFCESLNCVSVHINHEIMTRKSVSEIKKINNAAVLCYTVNDPARAHELFSWGVDAVFSDFPDRILAFA